MENDKFLIEQAREIRRMANKGCDFQEIQQKLGVKKKRLIEILEYYYSTISKDKILGIIKENEIKKINDNKKELIVIDTSFFISKKFEEVELFLNQNKNSVIPGPVLAELPTDTNDEIINFTSRRLLTIFVDLNIQVEAADGNIKLDPTWTRNHDYYILTVCEKLKNQGFVVKILSFDKQLILKAKGIGVERFPMEFPQDNVKHCDSYISGHNECAVEKQRSRGKSNVAIPAESLQALKDKFSKDHNISKNKQTNEKRQEVAKNFEKPKINESKYVDDSIPKVEDVNGNIRLVDTSCVDIVVGILKVVITKSGKFKTINNDNNISYYDVDYQDLIIIFKKLSSSSLEMKIGRINDKVNFVLQNTEVLQRGNMGGINKRYHEAIRMAYMKILKINIKKVI